MDGVVVAPFAVFGRVVDGGAVDFDLAQRQVALVVGLVVECIPEVELDEGEQLHRLVGGSGVGDPHSMDPTVVPSGTT